MLRTIIKPGTPTPARSVPASVIRPEYVGKPAPAKSTESWVQTDETIEKMRLASRLAARAMGELDHAGRCRVAASPADSRPREYVFGP